MKRHTFRSAALASALLGLATASPARAVPGGEIGTLPIGVFACELPDDATSTSRLRVPEEDFEIVSASSYVAKGVRGTYLLTGDHAVMTSGPYYGKQYHRTSFGVLKIIDADGQDGRVRCAYLGRANS